MISKKASLNLSIQMIVIVVIAFVVLGLGLGFVRSQFGSIESTSTAVQEQISQQILDDLRTGNKKLSFPATKLVIETGEESVQALGIKNTKDTEVTLSLGFQVKADVCSTASDTAGFCEFESEKQTTFTKNDQEVSAVIIWDNSPQSLKAGETRVLPVTVTAPDRSGNYLYKAVLRIEDTNSGSSEEFDSKTFFIKTS